MPLLNSEQLYQALRRLGRETELVIYPDEDHAIARPSFQVDRYQRYLDWYGQYLKPEGAKPASIEAPEATSLLGRPLTAPALTAERKATLDGEPGHGHGRLREVAGRRGRDHLAGTAHRVPGPLPRGDRHLHARPGEASAGRAASTATAATAT